jgi:hypothetical protein
MILAIWLRLDRMTQKKMCIDQSCSGWTNLYLDGELASNAQLIDRVKAQAQLLGKQAMTLDDARQQVLGQ